MAITSTAQSHAVFALSLTVTILACFVSLSESHPTGGFSVDLIHRDSPNSPFFNPAETIAVRVSNAIRRSATRAHSLHSRASSVSGRRIGLSEIINTNGEYLLNISIGTPPFSIFAIADTGSDLTWTQCRPCKRCYKQNYPLFNPRRSTTYRPVRCGSRTCRALAQPATCSRRRKSGTCRYSVSYGDGSSTNGVVATDRIALGTSSRSAVSLRQGIFGCGYDNKVLGNEAGSGVIGLGGGPSSIISQMDPLIAGKFSYCLVNIYRSGKSSKMRFGNAAVVSGHGAVSTPLFSHPGDTFYYLRLEAITVGNRTKAEYSDSFASSSSSSSATAGNIVIDSGTTVTRLATPFYHKLVAMVRSVVRLPLAEDPSGLLDLCFSSVDVVGPKLIAHFAGGVKVVLRPLNVFVKVADEVLCLAFAPSDNLAIWGSLAQMNFQIGYDLKKRTVTFKRADCVRV
ncbi:aspartic proteinase CDR1-like [Malania oleifera]|uniref:aspartic proteinase CDR1-like n=1 Tax=Malania oleifera TaxID=397392 RepID=UPI0025ADA674|nr:aspartic proteinase CDR1-like [Malania oleifera]